MAAVEPLRVAAPGPGPSVQTEEFDIDLLCAKLEAVKRRRDEREAASLLRKQVRDAVRQHDVRQNVRPTERRSTTTPTITTQGLGILKIGTTGEANVVSPTRPRLQQQQYNHSFVRLSPHCHGLGDHKRDSLSPLAEDREEVSHIAISRSTSGGSSQPTPGKSKRRSFQLFKNLTDDGDSKERRRLSKDRPDDGAKRRSITSPTFPTRTLQADPIPEHPWDRSAPPPVYRTKAASRHSLSLVNEYTVCFDTSHDDHRSPEIIESPQSLDRPGYSPRNESGEGMRSLLNLPSMLKKDRKEHSRTTVNESPFPYPASPPPPRRPLIAEDAASPPPAQRPAAPRLHSHTRSHTAPEDLIAEAVQRMNVAERTSKKRKSIGGLLHTLLVPDHRHTSDTNYAHCVAI